MIYPGDVVAKLTQYIPGYNTFARGSNVVSSVVGKVQFQGNVVKVQSQFSTLKLQTGSLLLGKVIRIREDKVQLQLLQIEGKTVNSGMFFQILKQHIKESMIDQLKMHQCFIPGDIVLAKLLSFGDGRRLYASTADKRLGVKYAKDGKQLMLPISCQQVVNTVTGKTFLRKGCYP